MFKHLTGADIVFVPYKGAIAGDDGCAIRANEHDVRGRDRNPALSQERKTAGPGGDKSASPARNSRRADHDRSGLSRHAAGRLAGDRRAGRHAAGYHRQNQRHREPRLGRSASAGPYHRSRRRSAADVAVRFRRFSSPSRFSAGPRSSASPASNCSEENNGAEIDPPRGGAPGRGQCRHGRDSGQNRASR